MWGILYVRETEIREFFLEGFDEFGTDLVLLVVFFVFVSLLDAGVTANGGDVDHAASIFSERSGVSLCFCFFLAV